MESYVYDPDGRVDAVTDPSMRIFGFTWDGVGLGEDGTLWGGEALLGRPGSWRRVASLRTFRLPGGERAMRECRRTALGLLLALALGAVSRALGTGDYVAGWVGDALPAALLPVTLFLVSGVIAFAVGSSWGTFSIMLPIAMPVAAALGIGEGAELRHPAFDPATAAWPCAEG